MRLKSRKESIIEDRKTLRVDVDSLLAQDYCEITKHAPTNPVTSRTQVLDLPETKQNMSLSGGFKSKKKIKGNKFRIIKNLKINIKIIKIIKINIKINLEVIKNLKIN